MISLSLFLQKIEQIAAENPSYRIGGSGADGTCDCVGLIMGAFRRAGGKWPWLHSSNDVPRKGLLSLKPIRSASDLSAGDLVFKHLEPGQSGYSLPSRYAGDPDRNDYFHVGVVLSAKPLRIRHMTSPAVMLDTKLGRWSHYGWCTLIRKPSGDEAPAVPDSQDIPAGPDKSDKSDKKGDPLPLNEPITVESTNGLPVKLRDRPSTSCPLYREIPSGAAGVLLEEGEHWCRIETTDRNGASCTGWMMSDFVVRSSEDSKSEDPRKPESQSEPKDERTLKPEAVRSLLSALAEIERQLDTIKEVLEGRK